MNVWSNRTGSVAAVVAAIHLIRDQVDPARLLLRSAVADIPKRALHAVWHLVGVDRVLGASTPLYLGIVLPTGSGLVAAVFPILAFQLNLIAVYLPCRSGCYFFPSLSIIHRRSMMRDGWRLHDNLMDVTT